MRVKSRVSGKLREDVELIKIPVDNDMSKQSLGVVKGNSRIGYGVRSGRMGMKQGNCA